MERAKLVTGKGHLAAVSRAVPRKKTAPAETKRGRLLRKTTGSQPKSGKLVCRYCGSDELAPSFVKRRDRRCRKCFNTRYGSAARKKKAAIKK